jgi:hypothetical protein
MVLISPPLSTEPMVRRRFKVQLGAVGQKTSGKFIFTAILVYDLAMKTIVVSNL